MVAHTASSCCDVVPTSSARRTRRRTVVPGTTRPPTPAVAPRRPWRTTPRDKVAGNGKARIRRCVEVRRKMEALRRLVPSGDGEGADDDGGPLGVDELLFRAADYIARLQVQVKVMQHMVDVLEYTKDQ